jgi:large subunit ribosomal protein L2
MGIKFFKPYTSTTRHKSVLDFSLLSKTNPEKTLLVSNHRAKGRNNQGKITIRHKGGGHKRRYRQIDFKRNKWIVEGKISSIEYDPNRSANIALVTYSDGEKRYIIHPQALEIGETIQSGSINNGVSIKTGNALPLQDIPLGSYIHNIELFPKKGGQVIRAAGTTAKILAKENNLVIVRLSSKEIRVFQQNCFATIGRVSNADFYNVKLGKAGRNRWLGVRPSVRGAVMNPVDHPHGGGEGKCPIGHARPLTPWGKPALGFKTRKKKKKSDIFIIRSTK